MASERKPKRKVYGNAIATHGPTWCVDCGCVLGYTNDAFEAHQRWHDELETRFAGKKDAS